jgi:hypothetical protein
MPWKYNPFTDALDLTGGGASYIDGVVADSSLLPVTLGSPALDSVFLAKAGSGIWLVNRRPAGLYVRVANNGVTADWTYLGAFPEVNADANWELYNSTDPTKELKFDLSGLPTATIRTVTGPAGNGQMMVSGQAGSFTTLTANNGTLTASAPAGTFSQTWDDQAVFTASASGTTLTVTAVASGTIRVGMLLYPSGFPGNERTVASLGTGTGGTGTYILSSASGIGSSITWTGVLNTFKALTVNAVSTSALSTATLFEAQANGTPVFSITRNGNIALSGEIDLTRNSSTSNRITSPAITNLTIGASGGGSISMWGSGYGAQALSLTNAQGAGFLFLGGANNIEMRNGTSPCGSLLLNNTFTSATNHERLRLAWSSNVAIIGTEKGSGGGSARALEFQTDGVTRLTFTSTGQIQTRQGLVFQYFSATASNHSANLQATGDGVLRLTNNGNSDFNRVQFGGTDSTFPALKRSSTSLQVRLADDSADAALSASLFSVGSGAFDGVIGRPNAGVIGFARADGATTYTASFGFDGTSRALVMNSGAFISWSTGNPTSVSGDLRMFRSGAGILRLQSDTSDFNRIQFGGTTTSFPALKRSGTVLQARLADDSGFATFDGILAMEGTAPATTGATGTAGELRYDADYIYVCTATNTWKRAAIATW